ncbi:DMT family transporter [Salinarimonas ramus]|uniref:Membrane protein n=1 Tax=Salinarimonas ramus TaxID=690164 RepID=A0A917Q5L3_9HYPH|nr:DMT family transporter [Salinarimonas ramus]GGK25073.1 membrane protein [Salinarimonas ramus]
MKDIAAAPAASSTPAPSRDLDLGAIGLYVTVVFSWGVSWIALKAQLGVVAPEVSLLWRFLIAAAIMLVWVGFRRDRMRWPLGVHLRFAAAGCLMFSMNFVMFYYGGLQIPSGLLAVVFSLASISNLVLGALVLKQPLETRVALGGAIGVAGVALLYYPQIAGSGIDLAAAAGLGLCLAATLSFSLGNIVSASLHGRGVPLLAANAWSMVYGATALLALSLVRGQDFIVEWTWPYLGGLAFLAIFASVIAFASYVTLLRRIGPARAGYATVMFPIVALAVSTAVEGYVWTLPAVLGAALALAGNVVVLARRR